MADGPDKGKCWLIAIAVLIINMIASGITRAEGLLFVEFIDFYEVDRKVAAIPFSVRTAVRNLAAPAIGILGQRYGVSSVTVVGGILTSFSSVLCYFATDMIWITLIWGGMNGFTTAMINVLPQIVISQYFIKYRSTAMGLSYSGCPVSALFLPVILEILLKTYGLHGTFLLLAGLFLHVIPAGMLLKKPSWYDKIEDKNPENTEDTNSIKEEDIAHVRKYRKASSLRKKRDCGIQVGNDKLYDTDSDKKIFRNGECKHGAVPFKRSHSHGSLMVQAQLNNLQLTTMFPRMSSIELNCRTFNKNPEQIYDVDIDFLKRHGDLVFHMLSMEIPNVEISYRAILLEVEQDDLWHPEQNEMLQEIESIYCHIEKSIEINKISSIEERPNGPFLRKKLLNETLSINKKTESLRIVKKYLKTYKQRGLQQLGKIRSAPNMSNIYNEIARKDYVLTKLKELCNGNEIRIISQLCQYNPKDVLRVLFQLRTLYNLYNDLECCDKCENEELTDSFVETGDIWSHRKESYDKIDITENENDQKDENIHINTFKVHIKSAIKLHTNLIFLLICCTRAAFFLSIVPMYTTIVDFGIDKGLEIKDGKYIIGALSLGDLLGRLCFGWITDRGYASLSQYMFLGMILQGAALICIPLMHTKWTILIAIALYGLLQSSSFVQHPVLIAKYLRPEEQSIAIGCMEFFSGILVLFIPMYIGYFRDNMGSYDPMFYINGAIAILFGIAWFFERCLTNKTCEERKN